MPNFFGTFLKFASPSVLCYTTAMSDAGSQFPHLSVEGLIFPFPYSCSICKASSHSFDISSRPISRHKRVVFSVLILSNREMVNIKNNYISYAFIRNKDILDTNFVRYLDQSPAYLSSDDLVLSKKIINDFVSYSETLNNTF